VWFATGPFVYLSTRACDAIVDHMRARGYNVLHRERDADGGWTYPYTVEDVGVAYILAAKGIALTVRRDLHSDRPGTRAIAQHTNADR
jgi:hypothetical protein